MGGLPRMGLRVVSVASEAVCSHPADTICLGVFGQSLRRNT